MLARLSSVALLAAIAGCMSTPPPLGMPDPSVIGFDGTHAVPPDCATLLRPSHLVDAGFGRPGVAFGCATYANLAVMLARPADLIEPIPYTGADAALGASAVRRYEEGRTTPLNSTSTTTNVVH
ncbi:CpaD family pilus assembly lipoprotein [Paraburkholderia sp. BL10I2N1]|uniref:CpaD family pilus assembly lipoprotein n=1 Tax=Paraburkholderia sp. BL10I2N1 TaxID=1938796 RepID=UPI0010D07659|nr:CpaD family pilus assembly lipoprotein [Paraburkholderia sp. BL10I2N1]TDN67275.1 pilus biogenesis CpaD protein [Paraburkholderia sp. BL10I2N1]